MIRDVLSWFIMVHHGLSWFVMVHMMVRDVSLSWFCHGSSWFVMFYCHGFVIVRDVLFSKILQKRVM